MTPPPPPPIPTRKGFAIASLVLGLSALFFSMIVVGALIGLVGAGLGVAHLRRKQSHNGLAWAGISLSLASLLVSIFAGFAYFNYFKEAWTELTATSAPASAPDAFQKWIGQPAPDLNVTTVDGQTIRLSQLKGQRVVLDFWATWCPPCVMEIPHFIQLRKDISQAELVIVGISSEDEATLKSFVAKKGINYPIASTDTLPAPFKEVESIPTTFCIDRAGLIQHVLVGYHDLAGLKAHATGPDFAPTNAAPVK